MDAPLQTSYAARMNDDSSKSPPTPPLDALTGVPGASAATGRGEAGTTHWSSEPIAAAWPETAVLSTEAIERSLRALFVWLYVLIVFGVGGLLLGQQELALLVAVSGVVVAAHAADYHPRFELLYRCVSVALIGLCGATLFGLAEYLRKNGPGGSLGIVIPAFSVLSGLALLATGIPVVGRRLARAVFGAKGDSHSARLAARLTLFGFLVAVPVWFAAQSVLESSTDTDQLFSHLTFGGAVFGDVILALAAVGFLMRRDLSATLKRLGLIRPRARDLLIVAIGVPAVWGLNALGEWGQQHWFPALWEADQRVNEALAGALDRRGMIALSLGAGIGEEITMRGALQPKLGLLRTSLFFAALHVQYSWYGMVMIFVFGALLGLIRKRSSTGVAMAVHAIYDLLALLST